MKSFTDKSAGYTECMGYKAFKTLIDAYLPERNYEKTLSLLDDGLHSVGTGKDEIATDKKAFTELLQAELEVLTEPIEYQVKFVSGNEIVENVWNIIAELEVMLPHGEEEKIAYLTRFTGCFVITAGGFKVTSIHMSEPSQITEEKEFLPLKHVSLNHTIDKVKTEQIVFDIMSKTMPGGVVCGYARKGLPLYFANERYLDMLGYASFEEYYKDADGLGTSHIHPNDRNRINKETMYNYSTENQHTIEYRIRHKDGHYIYVYDIGKMMITADGEEVIVSVLYDMTEDVKLRNDLIKESNYDALTGLYNRRGLDKQLEELFSEPDKLGCGAIIMIDADGLKCINDTYGHDRGDIYLKEIANIINNYGDGSSVASRQGGDEYVLFLYNYGSEEEVLRAIEALQYIQNHNTVHLDEEVNVPIRFSMGYSLLNGCTDYRELLKEADGKMYEDKLGRRKNTQ